MSGYEPADRLMTADPGRLDRIAEAFARVVEAKSLHDVGEPAISTLILDKPGRLTAEELARVREHPVHSLRILERASCFAPIAELAANHHERLDGSGYPRGLGAADLDLPMRVLAVADVYEALTADRLYREAMPPTAALALMARDVPGALDPAALGALEDVLGHRESRRLVAAV